MLEKITLNIFRIKFCEKREHYFFYAPKVLKIFLYNLKKLKKKKKLGHHVTGTVLMDHGFSFLRQHYLAIFS